MSQCGGTITKAGRDLVANLLAGEKVIFTRVVIGSGSVDEGTNLAEMTDLVSPEVEGTSSVPVIKENAVTMTLEYRNDMHGGLQAGFWINEVGLFGKTDKTEEEVLIYYATLGDTPQPVNAFIDNRLEIRRYPITLAASLTAEIVMEYDASAFVTSKDMTDLVTHTIGTFVHEFFHISMHKPSVAPALWFDTTMFEDQVALRMGDNVSDVSAVIDEEEQYVENASDLGDGDGTKQVEIT